MSGKKVDVTLRLIDKMTSPLNKAGQALAKQAQQMKRAGSEISKAGKNISNIGSSLTKSVTMPIAAAGVACTKLAADFEQGMSKVQSISGASGKQLDKLSKKAKEMGAKTKYSATEATEAYQYMAMAGWKTKDMLNGIEPVMKLAGASGEDLALTSDILTDSLTAFGKTAKDAGNFADVMAAASSNANTNVAMMGESFKYCAPVAGALGFSMKDTSVAIGLMANSGVKASNAGTAMRSWMSRMAAPTDAVQGAMNKLGLSITDSKGKMKSFATIMQESKKAFSGLTEAEKSQYASVIAGKAGMSGMLAVVNSSDKDFKKLTSAVKQSTGACNKMYDVANNNLNGQLTILKSTLESIAISFGEKLTPYVKKATDYLQKMADKFNKLSDAQQNTIIKIALVAAAVGPCLLIFGKMVSSVGKAVMAVGKIGSAFKKFETISAMIASPAGIVIGVLVAIAVAAFLVVKNWKKIKPIIDKVVVAMQPAIKIFKDMLDTCKKTFAPVGDLFKKSFGDVISENVAVVNSKVKTTQNAINVFGKACTKVMQSIAPAVKKATKTVASTLKIIIPIVAGMLSTVLKAMPKIQKAIAGKFNAILPILKEAGKLFAKIGSVIMSTVSKEIKAAMPVVKKFGDCFNTVFPIIANIVTAKIGIVTEIIKKLQPVAKFVFGCIGDYVSILGNGIAESFAGIMKTLGGLLDFITGVFTGNWKKAWSGVKNIFVGIFSSFASVVKTPINAVISLINKAISGINGISVDIPDGVPGVGGKHIGFNISKIPMLARGTKNWKGGIVQISENGGEIVDLPQGSRVYPHDESVRRAYRDGARTTTGTKIIIQKLADNINVREEADIDKIVAKLAAKLEKTSRNLGGGEIEYLY